MATKAGYIDVLCIDGDGVLTVIETKLARNSQIRREVVGQVLEYVAQLSTGRILLNFGVMKGIIPDEELHAFRELLNQLPDVELPTYMVDEGKYPSSARF